MVGLLGLAPALSDGRMVLDAFTLADAEARLAGEDAEMRRRFDARAPATLEQTREAIRRWMAAGESDGPMRAYALRDQHGQLMGGCEARSTSEEVVEVSYWVFASFRGRGLASRALRLLCGGIDDAGGARRIEAHIDADNLASRRAAKRAGFIPIGEVRDKSLAGGELTRLL